jgi:hypothetical protein
MNNIFFYIIVTILFVIAFSGIFLLVLSHFNKVNKYKLVAHKLLAILMTMVWGYSLVYYFTQNMFICICVAVSIIPLIFYLNHLKMNSHRDDYLINHVNLINRFVDYLDIWFCLIMGVSIGYPIALFFYSGILSLKEQINLDYILTWGRIFLFGIPIMFIIAIIYTGVTKWESLFPANDNN